MRFCPDRLKLLTMFSSSNEIIYYFTRFRRTDYSASLTFNGVPHLPAANNQGRPVVGVTAGSILFCCSAGRLRVVRHHYTAHLSCIGGDRLLVIIGGRDAGLAALAM